MTRPDRLRIAWIASIVVVFGVAPGARRATAAASDNVVLQWNQRMLQAVGNTRFAPMLTARALAITHTCMYDAWAAYDTVADGVYWTRDMRQPAAEHTQAARAEAISAAAHLALVDLFPSQASLFDMLLSSLEHSTPGIPGMIGKEACQAVLDSRRQDGSNQSEDLYPGSYSDYTGYMPVNTVDANLDPNRWQPLMTPSGAQQFLAPHWGRVQSFALTSFDELRPEPPPLYPHGTYIKEANQILHASARLGDRSKMIAEYWSDGPASVTPPGHWNLFAQAVSRRDGHTLDEDVKMFFALGNAVLDASIAVWDCKRLYDYARPVTAIRFLYGGQPVRAWGGPRLGTRIIDGEQFRSYIPTPPFAEYVSGHSAFSAASAEVLAAFTGSDLLGLSVTFPPGSSMIEPGLTPAAPVTLTWRTFSAAADEAGMSRRMGGIHFESGDLAARVLGRQVGSLVWKASRQYFDGTARAW
ncbi:MAG: vanadium-dependent haloperoxidase [Acidobacteria bacterium]|nr:vanadium-dependent haloperoxidase [Acidobacteriota bacterium]